MRVITTRGGAGGAMGIQDRDYFRDRSRQARSNARPSVKKVGLKHWGVMALLWSALLLLLIGGASHFGLGERTPHLPPHGLSTPGALQPGASDHTAPKSMPLPAPAAAPLPPPQTEVAPMPSQPRKRPVNPPDVTPTPAAAPATRTVYLCKAYSGGIFWSSAHCQTQSALVDRIATVPAGNPPDKPKAPEVEFSMKEVLREEVEIYGQPDHGCLETC